MTWEVPPHLEERHQFGNINEDLLKIKGTISDDEAKIALVKYLRANLGVATKLICGIELYPLQEIILRAMFANNYSMFVMGRGAGKCQHYSPESFVITKEHGLISLTNLFKDLKFKNEEYVKSFKPIHLWNGKSFQEVSNILVQNDKNGIELKSKNGHKIAGSTRHMIKCFDKEAFCFQWKRLGEMDGSELLCLKRDNIPDWSEEKQKTNAKLAKKNYDLFIEKDFEDFSNGVSFKNKREIRDFLIHACQRVRPTVTDYSYFLVFYSKCEKKISFIQTCLSLFGIRAFTINTYENKQLNVMGINFKRFYKIIGKYTPKAEILAKILNRKRPKGERNIVPRAFEKLFEIADYSLLDEKTKNRLSEIKQREELLGKKIEDINISLECFKYYCEVFERAGIQIPENYKEIISEDFHFEKIHSIEKKHFKCIDFCDIPNGSCYWSNGFINHNSFLAAIFCILVTIFEPRTKIIIAGPNFRTAKLIFETIETIRNNPKAMLIRGCFLDKNKYRGTDQYKWVVNGGSIIAIPLSGEKIRGFRANILLCDEYLRLPEHIVKTILMPFLVAPQDAGERIKIVKEEDELIRKGLMKEEDRVDFKNTARMIALSSASYTFENLYTTFKDWINKINNPETGADYSVFQVGYKMVPEHLMDKNVIEEAQNGGTSNAAFLREYCARFTDGSDSYFSPKKMNECSLIMGDRPTVKIKGDPDKTYVLGIDPSFSNSPSSDFFAMTILECSDDLLSSTVVHTYAVAGGDPKDHVRYFFYIWMEFRPSLIIVDNAGWEFIEHANNSEIFSSARQTIKSFEVDSLAEGLAYEEMIQMAKNKYDPSTNTVYFKQYFHSDFIRKANQELQVAIDSKTICFGAPADDRALLEMIRQSDDEKFSLKSTSFPKPIPGAKKIEDFGEFVEYQSDLIQQTKKQCAIVELKVSGRGVQSFDLPNSLKTNSPDKARKDNYTTLMLANWGRKILHDISSTEERKVESTFQPFWL